MKIEHAKVLATKYKTLLNKAGINTKLRLCHFFAQAYHESLLEPKEEDLRYSAATLTRVFPKYFTPKLALEYQYKPVDIASRAYANRMENGNEQSKEGYKFRGRGYFQITGKRNYRLLTEYVNNPKVDYVCNPDLLLNEADSMIAAIWYWTINGLNKYADLDALDSISDIVNIGRLTKAYGDSHGFKHRQLALQKLKQIF